MRCCTKIDKYQVWSQVLSTEAPTLTFSFTTGLYKWWWCSLYLPGFQVPKCASTTLEGILEELSKRNNFTFHPSPNYWRFLSNSFIALRYAIFLCSLYVDMKHTVTTPCKGGQSAPANAKVVFFFAKSMLAMYALSGKKMGSKFYISPRTKPLLLGG